MADEILIQATMAYAGYSPPSKVYVSNSITQSGTKAVVAAQFVGTSAEALDIGDVAAGTLGYLWVKNLDDTNYVQLATDSGVSTGIFAKLWPGGVAIFPPNSNSIYGKADTAPCYVQVMAIEL